jgi:hypothetical protein
VNRPSRLTGMPFRAQVCADDGLVPRNFAMAVQPLSIVMADAAFFLGIYRQFKSSELYFLTSQMPGKLVL